MRKTLAAAVVIAAVTGIGLTACEAAHEEDQPAAPATHAKAKSDVQSSINWGDCPKAAEGAKRDAKLACGTVRVPLDYHKPDGEKIELAVSRLATAKPGKRRGVLVLNPGGPALPGLDMPGTMAPTLPSSVLDRYDLIGFDPRGVENSTPQTCGLKDPSVPGLFPYPAADGSIDANIQLAKADADQCADKTGGKLKYFNTANTARDLDRIRQALGEKKISYWGQSYGTYLGAVYNEMFKDNADRVILEGNVNPDNVWDKEVAGWGKGMSERFPDAAKVAAAANGKLGLGGSAEKVTKTYLALADRLDRTPAPVPGAQASLSGAMLRNVTYSLLLHNETLPVLAQVWKAALDLADGKVSPADGAVLKQVFAPTPVTPGVPADNQAAMFLALTCGDAEWNHDVDGYAAKVAEDRKEYPLTDGLPANVWACAFWHDKPIEDPVKVTDQGSRNTLILQNRRDNATPWDSAQGLHKVLGQRAGFVGADNGGHYVYHEGSKCVDQATVDFLTNGDLPDDDVYCTDVRPQG